MLQNEERKNLVMTDSKICFSARSSNNNFNYGDLQAQKQQNGTQNLDHRVEVIEAPANIFAPHFLSKKYTKKSTAIPKDHQNSKNLNSIIGRLKTDAKQSNGSGLKKPHIIDVYSSAGKLMQTSRVSPRQHTTKLLTRDDRQSEVKNSLNPKRYFSKQFGNRVISVSTNNIFGSKPKSSNFHSNLITIEENSPSERN
jgi:hypothetical protein